MEDQLEESCGLKGERAEMVQTATGKHAYRRPDDGVYVVPIGCLTV